MMNLFDLSAGMAGTKKAFRDGSNGGRNRSVSPNKAIDPVELHMEDKPLTCESRKGSSAKRSNTTPIKMLIAQEMCKDTDTKRKPPNVIARLMGLDDALPGDPSVASSKRNLLDGEDGKQRQVGYLDRSKSRELQSCCNEDKDFRDVYEVRRKSSRSNFLDDGALQNGLYESRNDKRMAFVRDKFIEAKRLATDEKLLESKEFHDALEVLSSNRDLFLKFLDEPNSLFLSRSEEHQFVPSPPQTKRITVLRPSKTNETKSNVKNQYDSGSELRNTIWNSGFAHHPMTEKLPEPTRIVVLKPSPRKQLDLRSPVTPFSSSPERPSKGDGLGGRKPCYPDGPNMAESLSRHRRDESLLSSVFSNGYIGDDSSFNRSDNYVGQDCDNSDSELGSYWDFMSRRYGSPYSHSPLSRASHSPESSSVVREAKKRLSERWALVTSNVLNQEKLQGRRSSGTLGEMLAINELKMENRNDNLGFRVEEFRTIGRTKEENGDEGSSGCSLSRSKSVPTSSATYESIRLNIDDSDSRTDKSVTTKVVTKSQSGKTSLKGRVTSLFFSKSKRSGRDESFSSHLEKSADIVDNINDNSSQAVQPIVPEISLSGKFEAESDQISPPIVLSYDSDTSKSSLKASVSHEEPGLASSSKNHDMLQMPEKNSENQNHPSPTSVLDAPFKDEPNENAPNSSKFAPSDNPQALSRSPPIESIARTLSWDDHCSRGPLPASLKLSRAICSKEDEDDSNDLILVQNLLTASGLYKNKLSTIFSGWHSLDIPLDPNLLDELSDLKEGGVRSRERRSNQKLVLDCLNLVLQELGHSVEQGAYHSTAIVAEDEGLLLAQVWPVVKSKLSGSVGDAENGGLVIERLLGRELTGSGAWTKLMQSEIAAISREIGEEVLEELVGEVLVG